MMRRRSIKTFLLLFAFLFVQLFPLMGNKLTALTVPAHAEDNGLAQTPPMGWNSWNKYASKVNEQVIMQMADAMSSNGMKDAGYDYINIDDCWQASKRDANGNIQVDTTKFPHGMKYLADYVHSKGLKLGIYSSNGSKTCQGLPGGQGYEAQDAKQYADWGIDYLKYDFCYNSRQVPSTYAPNIDKITIAAIKDSDVKDSGPTGTSYEAEDGTITGVANIQSNSKASGGKIVGYVGNNAGDLTINVNADAAGTYIMTIYFFNGDTATGTRDVYISVNGNNEASYSMPNTGGWSTMGMKDVSVKLDKGQNSIRFYNPEDSAQANAKVSAEQYGVMSKALLDSGRPMVFSVCEWGSYTPWLWAPSIANLWRTTNDISDSWSSMISNAEKNANLAQYAGPGAWNDPDMLEVGNGGMTDAEYRTHFSLWSIMASPLIAGNDLTNMSNATKSTLLNKEVIAVDQDPLGKQGTKIIDGNNGQVFLKPLVNGDVAILFLNIGSSSLNMSVNAVDDLGLPTASAYDIRDLWQHADFGSTGIISATVQPHGAVMYRVSPSTKDAVPASLTVSTTQKDIEQGQTVKEVATIVNNGTKPVSSVEASLDLPEGWKAAAVSPTTINNLSVGAATQLIWNVTAPPSVASGTTVTIPLVINYVDGTTPGSTSSSLSLTVCPALPQGTVYLSDIDWMSVSNGWGTMKKDLDISGTPITLGGVEYEHGLGTNSPSEIDYRLGGHYTNFSAVVGVDDSQKGKNGTVTFEVWDENHKLWDSNTVTGNKVLKAGDPPLTIDLDITGVNILKLIATDGGDGKNYDHADWADPKISSTVKKVTEFDVLSPITATQVVAKDTALESLDLPDTLGITVNGKHATLSDITWQPTADYDGSKGGTYTFYPCLPSDFIVTAKEIPTIKVTVVAPSSTVKLVTNFGALSADVAQQSVAYGTQLDSIALPGSLNATVNGEPQTISGITWTPSPSYNATSSGTYAFSPNLPEEYVLIYGVNLPQISVIIGKDPNAANLITGFGELASTIAQQSVAYGTQLDSITLPGSLDATVNGEPQTISGITWTSSPSYNAAASGAYTFTPSLPTGYALTDGVSLPKITVTVASKPNSGNSGSNSGGSSSGKSSGSSPSTGIAVTLPVLNGSTLTTVSGSFLIDTTTDVVVGLAGYTIKIVSNGLQAPNVIAGSAGVFSTQMTNSGNVYLIKLVPISQTSARSGIYLDGIKLFTASVGAPASGVQSDTTLPFAIQKGSSYLIRLTAQSRPTLTAGTADVVDITLVKTDGNQYFYRIVPVGSHGNSTGLYVNGINSAITVVTIS